MSKLGLADNLRSLRNTYGYTQEDVSIQLNIERQTYNHYENNRRTPSLEIIIALADFYQVTIDELVRSNSADIATEITTHKNIHIHREIQNHTMSLTKIEAAHIQTIRNIPLTKREEIYNFTLFKKLLLDKTSDKNNEK
jgi:Predicted transcriptional regulators